jgi:hypothetical protein
MPEIPLDELEKAANEEFEKRLDDYLAQYREALAKFLKARRRADRDTVCEEHR